MKNTLLQFSLAILVVLFLSCSTSSDGNGNSTTDVVPVAPSNLLGTVASTTQINLSWTDNSTNEIGFKIERKSGTGIFTVVGTTTSNITTFIDNGLTSNTVYIYRVYSYNSVGDSPIYSNEILITTTSSTSVADIEGNIYQIVTICNQKWTKNNLNVSKYSDGTPIPQADPVQWGNLYTGAWCYYNNDPVNGAIYGKLYNWYAVMGIYDEASYSNPALRKRLAPTGWHVPNDAEWTLLTNCLGGETIAGGKMKSTGTSLWQSPNTGATNDSDFTGLPGGIHNPTSGTSTNIGKYCYWWSTTQAGDGAAWFRRLNYNGANIYRSSPAKTNGFSVRCVKD